MPFSPNQLKITFVSKRLRPELDPVFFELFPQTPRKGDQRKYEIIQAAIRCIARDGIQNIGFETIGRELGIGRSHVVYHFDSIDRIVLTATQYIVMTATRITIDGVSKAKTPRERLCAYVKSTFEWANKNPEQFSAFVHFWYRATYDPEFRELHTRIRAAAQARIQAILFDELAEASAQGRDALARSIHALLTGNLVDHLTCSHRRSFQAVRDETVGAVLRLLTDFEKTP